MGARVARPVSAFRRALSRRLLARAASSQPSSSSAAIAPAASPGASLAAGEVDTPALLLDLDAFDRNCARMVSAAASLGVSVRPHGKAFKSSAVARRLVAALGCSGVCAQTAQEAEAFVRGGVRDVLLSNEVAAPAKVVRLAELAAANPGATLAVCVDDEGPARALSAQLAARSARVAAVVECDVGQGRCGTDTPEETASLAKLVDSLPGLSLGGVQCYHGGIQHVRTPEERAEVAGRAHAKARAHVAAVRAAGLPCGYVTGGGTGTFHLEASTGMYTEVQPGSYFFGDLDYGANDWAGVPGGKPEQAIHVLATVVSRSEARRVAVVDAGTKAVSMDSGPPAVDGVPGLTYRPGGDEHGILDVAEGAEVPAVGTQVRLVPGHVDPTTNMHAHWVMHRGGVVEEVAELEARGPGL